MTDEVNEPTHYNQNGIEVIEVIETYAKDDFRLANVIKYVCRCEYKGNKLQDLKKAQWYLNRCVQELEADVIDVDKPFLPAQHHHEFVSSLASRIAGEDDISQELKDAYYKFDRFEIQGYCASCDKEINKGTPYITSNWFEEDLKFCTNQCVESLKAWQKDWSPSLYEGL